MKIGTRILAAAPAIALAGALSLSLCGCASTSPTAGSSLSADEAVATVQGQGYAFVKLTDEEVASAGLGTKTDLTKTHDITWCYDADNLHLYKVVRYYTDRGGSQQLIEATTTDGEPYVWYDGKKMTLSEYQVLTSR